MNQKSTGWVSSDQPDQSIDGNGKHRCGGRAEQKSRQADMKSVHCGCRPIHASFHRVKKIDSDHDFVPPFFRIWIVVNLAALPMMERVGGFPKAGIDETLPINSWRRK